MARKLLFLGENLLTMLIAALAVCAVAFRLMGYLSFSVLSGSMEPAIPTGALIWVKPVPAAAVTPGQVITFLLSDSTVVTHRVTEILPDETDPAVLRFRTKGDANSIPDAAPVHQNNLIGTPVLILPGLGKLLAALGRPPGIYLAASAGLMLPALLFLPEILHRSRSHGDTAGNG